MIHLRRIICSNALLLFLVLLCGHSYVVYGSELEIKLKLPFEKDESFVITRGYGPNSTHKNNDLYALDFTKNNCLAYNNNVLSVADGEVFYISVGHGYGETRSYGNQVQIKHDSNIISRYAHLNQVLVTDGQKVKQGQIVGTIGNTGTCFGNACPEHPGTHLHFAMYKDGETYKPEPMSGYSNFKAGEWYTSDNELYDPNQPTPPPTQNQEDTSWWQKIFEWFKNLFAKTVGEVASEQEQQNQQNNIPNNPEPTPVFNAQFVSQSPYPTLQTGQTATLSIKFKNTGNTTWKQSEVSLNIVSQAGNSPFYHSSWLTQKRPTKLDQQTVAQGEVGSFTFTIQAPSQSGIYQFFLRPVYYDGQTFNWLGPDFKIYWLIKILAPEKPATATEDNQTDPWPLDNLQIINNQPSLPTTTPIYNPEIISGGGGQKNNNPDSDNSPPPAPIITSPTSSPQMFFNATSTIFLAGTKSEDSAVIFIWHNNLLGEITQFDLPNEWQKQFTLIEGENEFRVAAADAAGSISEENKLIIFFDQTAPTAISNLKAGRINSSTAQTIFTPPENALIFDLRHSAGNLTLANWDDASSTSFIFSNTNTSTQIIQIENLTNINNLKFYVRSRDQAGNWSDISNAASVAIPATIGAINAFETTPNSILAEWLMPKFSLQANQARFDIRYSDELITADNFAAATALTTDLIPEPNIVNYAKLENLATNTDYYLAVRYFDGLGWSDTFFSDKFTTTDNYSKIIACANCAFMTDYALKKQNSPYVVEGMAFSFRNKILTIEPGVILKFKTNSGLWSFGAINAIGTSEEPIIFTSFKDDNYGGDTNDDGESAPPQAGDWNNINVLNSSVAPTIFKNVTIKYGSGDMLSLGNIGQAEISSSNISSSAKRGLKLWRVNNLTLKNNNIEHNKLGVYLDNIQSVEILFNNITNNNSGTYQEESGGMFIARANAGNVINNNNIYNNNFWGIFAYDGVTFNADNNYYGSQLGPLPMTMAEFLADPHQHDGRGQRDIIHGDFNFLNFSTTPVA